MTKKTLEELQQFFTDNGIKYYQYPLKDDFNVNRFLIFAVRDNVKKMKERLNKLTEGYKND